MEFLFMLSIFLIGISIFLIFILVGIYFLIIPLKTKNNKEHNIKERNEEDGYDPIKNL